MSKHKLFALTVLGKRYAYLCSDMSATFQKSNQNGEKAFLLVKQHKRV